MDFTQSSSLFFKVTIAVPSSNSSIGMENNDEFYGLLFGLFGNNG